MKLTNSIGLYGVIMLALSSLAFSCSKSTNDLPQVPYFTFSLNNSVIPLNDLKIDTVTPQNSIWITGKAVLPGMVDSTNFALHFWRTPSVPAGIALGSFADSAAPSQSVEITMYGKLASSGASYGWVNNSSYFPSVVNIVSNNTYSMSGTFQAGLVPDSALGTAWPAGLDSLKFTNGTFYTPL
jgi:hypothetical protein